MTQPQPRPFDLDTIQARTDAATSGPWEAFDTDQHWSLHVQGFPMQILKAPKQGTPYAEYWPNKADGEFIAHARTDVPALIARVRQLEAELADHRQALRQHRATAQHALHGLTNGNTEQARAGLVQLTVSTPHDSSAR